MSEVLGFARVERRRAFDGANGAEPASARALLTGDHERGVAAGPAFVEVWAASLLTDGVELVVFHRRFGAVEDGLLSAAGKAGSKPFGEPSLGGSGCRGGGHGELSACHSVLPLVHPVGGRQKRCVDAARTTNGPTLIRGFMN